MSENKMSFRVAGMTCTTCSRIVERTLSKVEGVTYASVNLATESAFVAADDSVTFEMLEAAVEKSGYKILKNTPADIDDIKYREARKDLFFILLIGIPMSVLMFMHMVMGIHYHWYGMMEAVAGSIAIFWGGRKTLRGAWIALAHAHTNMDTLIAISAAASWATALMNLAGLDIPSFGTIGVMILMLHLTGRYIESHLRDRAAKQVKALMTLQPREARVVSEENTLMVPIEAVKPDTIIQVNPGERIPLDGVVIEGLSGVDESLLTGESQPVAKDTGSDVTGGAMNLSGVLLIKTTKVGEDTFLSKMLDLVREAQGSKVPLQDLADRITLIFVPAVISLAVISALIWYFFFDSLSLYVAPLAAYLPWPTAFVSPVSAAAYSFVATLVIACPCALGLATPLALVVSTGEASKNGLLIRNAEAIQTLHEVDHAILDKTGTLTLGEPEVIEWELPEEAIPFVCALESNSGHPVAKAVVNRLGIGEFEKPESAEEVPGEGITGRWGNDEWFVGRPLNRSRWTAKSALARTIVEVRKNGEPIGFFAISDPIRSDSKEAVSELARLGITTVMATGDGMEAALEIADQAGIENVRWEVRPEDKLSIIREAQSKGKKVLMAGDGINDAAALKGAHVGVAMGGGMDLAVDSADIVILKGGISKIVSAVKISDKTWQVIRQNLFGAFFYNIIAIPLAMLGLLHPLAAEIAMAASSITVILNSLRISGSAEK
ncbi:MAG TPA: cation-translocating P-type ATPase [Synergistaceae bacterium]|jgi:Cu+-exporting ATPase|nr:cation-translocating P-type ATPase [Synergistaceae bacterium]NLL41046.1 cation-translocating P-type ATPase [Synergistaceae bacterium]HPX03286.1 cation-translocating P-type ATPase [Synergistaceae bacterium]